MSPDLRQEQDRQDASQAQELTRTPGGKNVKPLSNCVCGKNRWQEQNMWQELQVARTGYPLPVAPVKNMQRLSYKKFQKNIRSAKKLNLLSQTLYQSITMSNATNSNNTSGKNMVICTSQEHHRWQDHEASFNVKHLPILISLGNGKSLAAK